MDIKKILKDAAADKIASKFNLPSEKVDAIIDTIASAVSGDKTNMGSQIVSDLKSKDNLSESLAVQIKDMVLPLIMESVSKNAGGKISGLLGKFKL
jgi:nucleoid DNA-binding protein